MNKYRSKKVVYKGEKFDSKKEANRYGELLLLQRAGKISDLKRQVRYLLIPAQYDEDGKNIERCCTYVADFVYKENTLLLSRTPKG